MYDQIIPIVDYTNLFIFGLTVAMAWQLPDKPHYPPKKPISAQKRKYTKVKDKKIAVNITHSHDNYHDVYNHSEYHNYVDNDLFRKYLVTKVADKLRMGAYAMRMNEAKRGYFASNSNSINWNDNVQQRFPIHYEPYAPYPALKMRRNVIEQTLGDDDVLTQHHIHHHFSTRLDLYRTIAKYLDA